MKAKNFVLLLLISTAALSFFYSREIYRFHLQAYYRYYKKLRYDDMLSRARELYKHEKFRELDEYLKTMTRVFDESQEVRRLQGMNLMKLGDERRGIDLVVSTINWEKIEPAFLGRITELMFGYKLYQDIVSVIDKNGHGEDYSILLYYGVSLVKTGKSRASLDYLLKARKLGEYSFIPDRQFDLYYYLGSAYENTGNLDSSLVFYNSAWALNPRDPELKKALLRIYRKKGMYKEAEKLIRS